MDLTMDENDVSDENSDHFAFYNITKNIYYIFL